MQIITHGQKLINELAKDMKSGTPHQVEVSIRKLCSYTCQLEERYSRIKNNEVVFKQKVGAFLEKYETQHGLLTQLREEYAKTVAEREHFKASLARQSAEVATLMDTITMYKKEKADVNNELALANQQIRTQQVTIKRFQEKLDSVPGLEDAIDRIEGLTADNDKLNYENRCLESQNEEMENEIYDLKQEAERWSDKYWELEESLKTPEQFMKVLDEQDMT